MHITLGQKLQGSRSYNLNFIKFIAAILVIYSHSFYVCYGKGHSDPMDVFTNGRVSFGAIAVAIFLFVSGLYVSKSLEKCKSGKIYFGARIVRIFPLLITIILLTTFVLGPILTNLPLKEYLTDLETYRYLRYIILIPIYSLPGVFTTNPTSVVNGPLWTLVLEMICYVLLYILYQLGFFDKRKSLLVGVVLVIGILFLTIDIVPMITNLSNYLRPLFLFFIGMLCYIWRDNIVLDNRIAMVSFILMVICFYLQMPNLALLIFLPYCICWISYFEIQCSKQLSLLGNYSYAIYLIAYPIQQTLRLSIETITPIMNTVLTSFIAIGIAILLNKCIEEPCIKFYNKKWRK